MKMTRDTAITLSIFFLLTIIFYFLGYWLIFRTGKATPLMLSVGVAVILTCLIRKRKLSELGWEWGEWKYQWMSYLIPFTLAAVAYLIIWLADFGGWYNSQFVLEQKENYNLQNWNDGGIIVFHFLLTATVAFMLALPSVLGEEVAWRGFLVPELAKFLSFTGVALVSGFLWSIWHWPLIIIGIYSNDGSPLYYQLFFFTLYIMSASIIMTYLRYKTNSLWTAVMFHASLNIFLQKVFTPLTLTTADSGWYIDEFGAVPALVFAIAAFYFWKKGKNEFERLKP